MDTTVDAELLRDLFRGCLVWGAVGDAMGRPVESADAELVRNRYGPDGPHEYTPWHGWHSGPRGTITDDTQLTMVVAESLVAGAGAYDGDDFARRLVEWLPRGRGVGKATRKAIERLTDGVPWTESGEDSAGNGAAMRAAPIGLVHALDASPDALLADARAFSAPTHAHPVGMAAAAALAAGVTHLVRARMSGAPAVDPNALVSEMADAADRLAPEAVQERRHASRLWITLGDRLREAADLRPQTSDVFERFWSGAFVLESLPCALHAMLRSSDDPLRVLRTAVSAGHDTDTIASMAGNLAGAWAGVTALEGADGPWWVELESRDELIGLADELVELVMKRAGG